MADEITPDEITPADNLVENRAQSLFSGVALAFPGVLLLVFGLPLAICLPAGIVFGHARLNVWGYVLLGACTIFGSIFVYGSTLLLRSATKAFKGQ